MAFNLLGGYRNTLDMDILVEMSDENLFKIVKIFKKVKMITKWETERERILRGSCMSAKKKLEGIRLINELADRVLSNRQKLIRQKLRRAF